MSDVYGTSTGTPAVTRWPISVQEAKSHLNVSTTEDDPLILSKIKAATLMLENRTQRCFVAQSRQLKMSGFYDCRYVRGRAIYPMRSPVKSVTSIKYQDSDGTLTTMPSSDYSVSTGDVPGRITEAYNASWPVTRGVHNDVTITYVAGHSTVSSAIPENVKEAVRMVVGHWYRNREAVLTGTISKEIEMGVDALLQSEHVESYA